MNWVNAREAGWDSFSPGSGHFTFRGPIGCSGGTLPFANERYSDLIDRARSRVSDVGKVLDALGERMADADQASEVGKLVEKIHEEVSASPPRIAGKPILDIIGRRERAIRSHSDFDDDAGRSDPVIDPITGKPRVGHEQGAWLSAEAGRAPNAVLSEWGNRMDIVDVQEIPAGSVVLRGPAAAMTGRSAWDGVRDVPPEQLGGGAMQVVHIGQCPPLGCAYSKPAARAVVDSYAARRDGARLRDA